MTAAGREQSCYICRGGSSWNSPSNWWKNLLATGTNYRFCPNIFYLFRNWHLLIIYYSLIPEWSWSIKVSCWDNLQTSEIFDVWWLSYWCWRTLRRGWGDEDVHAPAFTCFRSYPFQDVWRPSNAGNVFANKAFISLVCSNLNISLCVGWWTHSITWFRWPFCCKKSRALSWKLSYFGTSNCHIWKSSSEMCCKSECSKDDSSRIWS